MDKSKAIKRISRAIRRYYFDVLDENTLKYKIMDGVVYRWDKEHQDLTLLDAVKELIEPISRYVVERTSSCEWRLAEKVFQGYNVYKPGMGFLVAAFPEGLIRIMGNYLLPTQDFLTFLKKFYLSFPIEKRRFYLNLLKKIEESKQ